MKCPLIKKRAELEEGYEYDEPLDCLKEECAWWDNDRDICAVKSIFHDLTNVRIELRAIKDKMPHEE